MQILKNKFPHSKGLNKPLIRFNKVNYNKRMQLTFSMLNKYRKVAEDTMKMIDYTDFWELALIMQSDLFHEQLFESLRSNINAEKEVKAKMKDLAMKLGMPKESLQKKYANSFNDYLKTYLKELQAEVQLRGREDPSLLKADPEWNEKLKDPDGFMAYLDKMDVDLTPDTFYKYPEINKMILDMKPDELVQNFAEMYMNGIIDEDKMRLDPHVRAMRDYLPVYEEQLNETLTLNNDMWVAKLKADTLSYIKTVLDPAFQKQSISYAKTTDNMRVDVGLVICRDPIFLSVSHEDMEFGKYRRRMFKKHYFNIDKFLEEIEAFNDVSSEYWDVINSQTRNNNDNKPNIRKWNPEKNTYDLYSSNSKHWSFVDPNVKDLKSIQYAPLNRTYMLMKNKHTDQWEFPTLPLYNGDTFDLTKYRLAFYLNQEEFKVFYATPYPAFHVARDLHEYEKEDPKNKGFTGVRTYFFEAMHFRGVPQVLPNKKHPYTDHIFVPKHEFSKHVKKNYWDAFVTNLQEK